MITVNGIEYLPSADGKIYGQYRLGDAPVGGVGGAWSLSATNYVAAKMPMRLIFPRNTEANSWSYAKNAYPGTKWNIPICIQGGAWPFKYEIISNGGATGLAIGEELTRTTDVPTSKTLHTVGADYGVLSWDNPSTGTYSITVRVTDQGLNTVDVPITLTVGTANWLFVDPVSGNDTTGDGSIGSPFATLEKIHNDASTTTTYAGNRVYLRAGTTNLDGMTANNNNLRLIGSNNPVQYIGYPGEAAVLEAYEGWIVTDGADDFGLFDLTYQYATAYSPGGGTAPIYMVNDIGATDRITLFNVDFKDFKGSPANAGAGNSSIVFLPSNPRQNFAVSRCKQSGTTGTFTCSFKTTYALIEHHSVANATVTTSEASTRNVIHLKDEPSYFTVRACDLWDNNTWALTNNYGAMGVYGQAGANNVEFCWNTSQHPINAATQRGGALYNWGNNVVTQLVENIYAYRNSLKQGFRWEGTQQSNMANGTEVHEKNVLDTGTMPSDAKITSTDNIDAATYFDASMELTGASRTNYLGTHGAEVAE